METKYRFKNIEVHAVCYQGVKNLVEAIKLLQAGNGIESWEASGASDAKETLRFTNKRGYVYTLIPGDWLVNMEGVPGAEDAFRMTEEMFNLTFEVAQVEPAPGGPKALCAQCCEFKHEVRPYRVTVTAPVGDCPQFTTAYMCPRCVVSSRSIGISIKSVEP